MPDFIAHRLLCTHFSLPSLSLLEQCTSNCNSRHPVLKRFWGLKLTCFYVKFFNPMSHLLSLRVHLFFFFNQVPTAFLNTILLFAHLPTRKEKSPSYVLIALTFHTSSTYSSFCPVYSRHMTTVKK